MCPSLFRFCRCLFCRSNDLPADVFRCSRYHAHVFSLTRSTFDRVFVFLPRFRVNYVENTVDSVSISLRPAWISEFSAARQVYSEGEQSEHEGALLAAGTVGKTRRRKAQDQGSNEIIKSEEQENVPLLCSANLSSRTAFAWFSSRFFLMSWRSCHLMVDDDVVRSTRGRDKAERNNGMLEDDEDNDDNDDANVQYQRSSL